MPYAFKRGRYIDPETVRVTKGQVKNCLSIFECSRMANGSGKIIEVKIIEVKNDPDETR